MPLPPLREILKPLRGALKAHFLAVVLAGVIGTLMIAPQLIFMASLGSANQGLWMMKTDEEPYYIARIQQVYEGECSVNPFITEYRHEVPKATLSYADVLVALPGIILHVSAPTIVLACKFFLPAILALLVYALFWRLSGSRTWSLAAMAMILCGYNLLYLSEIRHLLRFETVYEEFLNYSRPVNPQVSSIFFFAWLHLLLSALPSPGWKRYLGLGVVFGLTLYIYLYCFTFLLALLAVLVCGSLALKRKDVALRLAGATAVGLLVASGFAVNMFRVTHSPWYPDFSEGLHLGHSHRPVLSLAGCIALFVFAGWLFVNLRIRRGEKRLADGFILALLVAAFAAVNQQVVTGKLLQEGHYHWYYNVPIFITALLYVGSRVLDGHRKAELACACAIVAVSLWSGTFVQISSYRRWHDEVAFDQRLMPAVRWIGKNTAPGSVVFANEGFSELVPIYTRDFVVWGGASSCYIVPRERTLWTPENILAGDFATEIRKYRVDYFVWDSVRNPGWKLNRFPMLRLLYEKDGLKIYSR